MRKILLVGPLPPPITGQAIAFSYLKKLEKSNENISLFNTQRHNFKLINYIESILILPVKILLNKYHTIYFTGSRSKFGFLRQLPFLFVTILKKIRIINHLHGADFKDFYSNSGILKPIINWIYNHVETTIILLDQMRDQFDGFNKMKLITVPNSIGSDFENLEIKFPKPRRILYLSNIMESKGIIEFLSASKKLLELEKDICIDIAGSFVGDNLSNKKKIKSKFYEIYDPLQKEFPNRIKFHGSITGNNKVNLFKSSSIFVLPTYYPTEAFPISILEAMASGNAIICTQHNYLKYIVNKNRGFLVPIKNENEIFDKLIYLLSNLEELTAIQKKNFDFANEHKSGAYIESISKIVHND